MVQRETPVLLVWTNKNNEFLEHVKKTENYRKILESFPDAKLINIEELAQKVNGYISYIRGETLDKYPIRLYPIENIVINKKINKLRL